MLDDVAGGGLHDGCFEGDDGLSAKSCSHGVSKDEKMCRGTLEDDMEEDVVEVSKSVLLLEDI